MRLVVSDLYLGIRNNKTATPLGGSCLLIMLLGWNAL